MFYFFFEKCEELQELVGTESWLPLRSSLHSPAAPGIHPLLRSLVLPGPPDVGQFVASAVPSPPYPFSTSLLAE